MQRIILLAFTLVVLNSAFTTAQITVTSNSIAQVGDSIQLITDNLPTDISITPAGPDQTWDFTSLQGPFAQVLVYEADSSPTYPTANARQTNGAIDNWYELSSDQVLQVGLSTPDPFGLIQGELDNPLDPGIVRISAPLNYEDEFDQSNTVQTYIDVNQIPDSLFAVIGQRPDSLRLNISFDEDHMVDAWGTVLLNNESFDVLRRRIDRSQITRVQAFSGFIGWVDVTPLLAAFIPPELFAINSRVYEFWADGEIEPVVAINTSVTDSVEQVVFKADIFSSVKDAKKQPFGVYVYPNPSFGSVRFEFFNIEPGYYNLQVMNIFGQEVWSEQSYAENTDVVYADLSELKRGTYFYALSNESGKRLVTRRLIIIKP